MRSPHISFHHARRAKAAGNTFHHLETANCSHWGMVSRKTPSILEPLRLKRLHQGGQPLDLPAEEVRHRRLHATQGRHRRGPHIGLPCSLISRAELAEMQSETEKSVPLRSETLE